MSLDIVIFGLSISSSWGNGHATTYRALVKALAARGHRVTFLERATPWYRAHRDLQQWDHCRIEFYDSLEEAARFGALVSQANLVILGSYVQDGIALGEWITSRANGVTAFYDIDTPVTLAALEQGSAEYISARLIPRFDLFLSFTGGPALDLLETQYGSPRARALYCSADPDQHKPIAAPSRWALGYLGTFSVDRQPTVDELLIAPALALPDDRFIIAGAQYPHERDWPANVDFREHVMPVQHAAFYCGQRFTLNATRGDMVARGYSPSVRLFEAAACGVPVISDRWPGIESVFEPDREILIAERAQDVIGIIGSLSEERRREIGAAARRRFLREHSPEHRAKDVEHYYWEAVSTAPELSVAVVA